MSILLVTFLFLTGIAGYVSTGGVPVPGATVIVTRGEDRFITITNPRGEYFLPNTVDDTWSVQIEMSGFAECRGFASTTSWELRLLPFEEMHAKVVKPEPLLAGSPADPPPAFEQLKVDASKDLPSTEPSSETPSTSGLFDNLDSEELNQRAMAGSLINGSIHNGADSPFAQPRAFGNNRFYRKLYSGDVGVTLGNSGLDAKPYSLVGQNGPKASYSNYAVSFNFGGLIRIPHVLNNGPYFLLHYEHKQSRNDITAWGRVPTALERDGDFSQSLDAFGQKPQLVDPATRLPLDRNIIRRDQMDPQALYILKLFPEPNFSDNPRTNYQALLHDDSGQDNLSLRLETNPASNAKNRFSGSFDLSKGRTTNLTLLGFADKSRNSDISAGLNWQTSIGRKFSAAVRMHWSRQAADVTPYFADRINVSGEAGINGNNQESRNWGPPNLEFSSGISPLSDVQHSRNRLQKAGASFAGSWYSNRHALSFGAGLQWNQLNMLSQQDARGTFRFTGSAAGYDFADFLFGIPQTASIAYGNADKYFRQKFFHAFVGDDWRIGHGFTINAGLRWEYETPVSELRGRLVNLDISPDFGSTVPMLGNDLLQPDRTGIEPRMGIAWRPGMSSLVIRGGYGIYRNTDVYQPIAMQMAQQSPVSKNMIVQRDPENPVKIGNILNSVSPLTANTFAIDPNFRIGYVQNWQLSIQKNLPAALQLVAMYMGIRGTHLPQEVLPKTFPSGAGIPSGYAYMSSNGNSIRHAGVFELRRRLRSGLAAELRYTFAKSIDNAPLMAGGRVINAAEGGSEIAQNWLDLHSERALSNFDQRHQVAAQMQYTSGMGVRGGTLVNGWKGTLLKDWVLQWQLKSGSGLPQTPIYLSPCVGVSGNLRPDYTGAPIQSAGAGLHLNPGAFRIPAADKWGNAGRNTIQGPFQFELSASLGRTFRLKGKSFDVRLDATNVLNHVTYRGWNTVINSVQFGLPVSASPMRIIRFSMRLRFDNGLI